MFSDHSTIILEIANRRLSGKLSNICKPNNPLLNFPYIEEKNKKKIKNYFELNGNEKTTCKKIK